MSSITRTRSAAYFAALGMTTAFGPSGDDPAELELLEAMAADWHSGARQPAEAWIGRAAAKGLDGKTSLRIIYEEICLREERGEQVSSAEVYARFPALQSQIAVLLDCHRLMDPAPVAAAFPEAGQQIGEFQLIRKLGRGAAGQVFLASQPALSDRLLVLKLTPRTGAEHLSLARLQHTHIAPLYLVQDFPERRLRALCMPYLGGASWSAVLHALRDTNPLERSGRSIVDALTRMESSSEQGANASGPAMRFLSRASYVQAVCWIGSCLADGLHYAHQRGLIHLDIKPSNVLLAADGQPMLLDFHLACEPMEQGAPPPSRLGGTAGYLSPEQALAASAVREGAVLPRAVDRWSDIFSLGVVLYESIVGHLPARDESASRSAMRGAMPVPSRALEDLVHKCLAADAANRYADAGQLADDLRRHLADLPLQGVSNRSLGERAAKWRRRRPHAFALVAVVAVGIATLLGLGVAYERDQMDQGRASLAAGQADLARGDYRAAIDHLEVGTRALRWLPGHRDLRQALDDQLARARETRLAAALHEVVEQLRFLDYSATLAPDKLMALENGCARLWAERARILPPPDSAANASILGDLVDLAAQWAELLVRTAPEPQIGQARQQALAILQEAQELGGTSLVLELARRDCAGEKSSEPIGLPATNAWEHHVLGRYFFRNGDLNQAQRHFARALELEPSAFWPNFYLTQCAYKRGEYEKALRHAAVCVALAPARPECFYNRALCEAALGESASAARDLERARSLGLDPAMAERAALQLQQEFKAAN
ncbi:MAG TPA: serine/threonine-protein kinase [Pirellulales bacterium]|jgi:serine/threonine protein kinase|nr:serine/threonine-protein kinase [Pirellulales bacterium]